MAHGNIDDVLENQNLKNEFSRRNLDLKQVWQPEPDDIENENCRLQDLLDWVITFEEFPNRKEMEMKGYQFPPVEPGISPDSDWLRFRKWVLGKPVRKTAISRLQDEINLKNPTELTDNEITIELKKLTEQLKKIHIAVDLNTGIPARLIYQYLLKEIKNEFELLGATGWWHIDGCSGYCPGCFQRPWCDTGNNTCWQEDEDAGQISFPDEIKKYVSPSIVSLTVLRQVQAQEDEAMKKWEKTDDKKNDRDNDLFF